MRENKYDDCKFFDAYSHMHRSIHGLGAAGEWHELKKLLPDFRGKRVLDIGCGYGWHCSYAVEQGAEYVLGTDISEKMLKTAREKNVAYNIEYQQMAMEDIDFVEGSFDIVMSSLTLHYTPDYEEVCLRVYKSLTNGGSFVFSAEHPIFTAHGSQNWAYDEDGKISHWPVDRYFDEGKRDTVFLGENVVKYHRTVGSYVKGLTKAGFVLRKLVEPRPAEGILSDVDMRDELRRPMMILMEGRKG